MGLSNATHLMVQLAGCNQDKLADPIFLSGFLDRLPLLAGMTVMLECRPIRLDADYDLDSGWTAVTILKESHASIHAFENMGFAYVDIFSCKSFDPEFMMDFIEQALEATDCEYSVEFRDSLFDLTRQRIEDERRTIR